MGDSGCLAASFPYGADVGVDGDDWVGFGGESGGGDGTTNLGFSRCVGVIVAVVYCVAVELLLRCWR